MKKIVIDLSHLDSVEIGKNGKYKLRLVDGSWEMINRSKQVDLFFKDMERVGKEFMKRYRR